MRIVKGLKRFVTNAATEVVDSIAPDGLVDAGKRFLAKDFVTAFSAGVALVVTADGSYDDTEKNKIKAFISNLKILESFNEQTIFPIIDKFVQKLMNDREFGEKEAYDALTLIEDNSEYCDTIIKVCIKLGESDGNFDESEKQVIQRICTLFGKDMAEYIL
jgi:tellurite resistance protein TerB